jgi:hypothetical protein
MKSAGPHQSAQRALVIGVGNYPSPIPTLPAVANDVREMAKLLSSKNGVFGKTGVAVVSNKQATRDEVIDKLRGIFGGASASETVFVYLAGHGGMEGDAYYFVAHDTNPAALKSTGVPLAEIKALFESTKSTRAFLWLDFCHSGGILARAAGVDSQAAIRRALGVVHGHGKVIVAACTASQSAYEDHRLGHGLFTDALLRGLRGEALSTQGEVTAHSLYEFIDHQVGSERQQPMFFGETTGRIVLMQYTKRDNRPAKAASAAGRVPGKGELNRKTTNWIMLGDRFFAARSIHNTSDGRWDIVVVPLDGEDEAALAVLRPGQFVGKHSLPFAAKNEAALVRVEEVESRTEAREHLSTIRLSAVERGIGGGVMDMTVNDVPAIEIARRRAGRILINEPPRPIMTRGGFDPNSFVESQIAAASTICPVHDCVLQAVFHQHGKSSSWREFARLKAVFALKATGTVEHVIDLTIGPVRSGKVAVAFKGRRARMYSNVDPEVIEIKGMCVLK